MHALKSTHIQIHGNGDACGAEEETGKDVKETGGYRDGWIGSGESHLVKLAELRQQQLQHRLQRRGVGQYQLGQPFIHHLPDACLRMQPQGSHPAEVARRPYFAAGNTVVRQAVWAAGPTCCARQRLRKPRSSVSSPCGPFPLEKACKGTDTSNSTAAAEPPTQKAEGVGRGGQLHALQPASDSG